MKMIKFLILSPFMLFVCSVYGQEICDNGIDDDDDGFIDLNDIECVCLLPLDSSDTTNLIPNHSFEEKSDCPDDISLMHYVDDWLQPSWATSDYYNLCDFTTQPGVFAPDVPLPGAPGGEGYAGFFNIRNASNQQWKEYIGVSLDEPLYAGVVYTLKLYTAYGRGFPFSNMALYGSGSSEFLTWSGFECPVGNDDWQVLSELMVDYENRSEWYQVSLVFSPSVDIYSIALGPDCKFVFTQVGAYHHYYVDELVLSITEKNEDYLLTSGYLCNNNFKLFNDTTGVSYQWYHNGIAIIGETSDTLNLGEFDYGNYSLVTTFSDGSCRTSIANVEPPVYPIADFATEDACVDLECHFYSLSSFTDGEIMSWDWDFGNGDVSNEENPFYNYTSIDSYNIELIVTGDNFCKDTITKPLIPADDLFSFAPNVFTPGNDDLNDTFFFPSVGIDEFNCGVFNRWGIKVFEFTDINQSWNGNNLMDYQCAAGVYFYKYSYTTYNGLAFKGQGNIHLIR